jgi:hypothetical protein
MLARPTATTAQSGSQAGFSSARARGSMATTDTVVTAFTARDITATDMASTVVVVVNTLVARASDVDLWSMVSEEVMSAEISAAVAGAGNYRTLLD